jgi:hypothetical protein
LEEDTMNAPEVPCPHCGALNSFTAKTCQSCSHSMTEGLEAPGQEQQDGERGGLKRLLSIGRKR